MNNYFVQKFFTHVFWVLCLLNFYLFLRFCLCDKFVIWQSKPGVCGSEWSCTLMVIEDLINEPLLNLTIQVFFIIIMSSWSRAAGPRARVDFLSDLTWKKILFLLVLSVPLVVSVHLFI